MLAGQRLRLVFLVRNDCRHIYISGAGAVKLKTAV